MYVIFPIFEELLRYYYSTGLSEVIFLFSPDYCFGEQLVS